MPTITLSEALAEVETIGRRLDKKQQLVFAYLLREQQYRDPLRPEGGSPAALAGEWEGIRALHERKVLLRRLIQQAYERTPVTFRDQTRSLADWLAWRRDVAARQAGFLKALGTHITRARRRAARLHQARATGSAADRPADVIVHLNEQELAQQAETLEELLGYLVGQLALKNATVTIDLPDGVRQTVLEEQGERLLSPAPAVPAEPALQPPWSTSPELCQLARDPVLKIAAIKLYRELTGAGLLAAKNAVEAFQAAGR
jgi:hypothetical protein